MDAFTKAKLWALAAQTENGFDRWTIWLAGNRYTFALFAVWTLAAVAFGWWAGK